MADRPITTLGAAEATDLAEDTVVLHIVNPARPLDVDKNRKMTRLQLPSFLPDNSVVSAKLASGIDAAKIADGTVSSAEFQHLNGVSSGIQAQIDAQVAKFGDIYKVWHGSFPMNFEESFNLPGNVFDPTWTVSKQTGGHYRLSHPLDTDDPSNERGYEVYATLDNQTSTFMPLALAVQVAVGYVDFRIFDTTTGSLVDLSSSFSGTNISFLAIEYTY